MKTRNLFFIICFIGLSSIGLGQEYAIDKGATFISGTGSILSQGGDLFEDSENNKAKTITISPSINHFISKSFFIGGGIELSNQSQGDYSINSIGIGPQLGYAIGNVNSKAFPYFDVGLRYYSMSIDYGFSDDTQASGTDIFLGFGLLIQIKSHIGLAFEGGYHMIDLKNKDTDESSSGNILSIGVGIVGLLF
jgi:hypothetical protein